MKDNIVKKNIFLHQDSKFLYSFELMWVYYSCKDKEINGLVIRILVYMGKKMSRVTMNLYKNYKISPRVCCYWW
jgi:hypothetical protein